MLHLLEGRVSDTILKLFEVALVDDLHEQISVGQPLEQVCDHLEVIVCHLAMEVVDVEAQGDVVRAEDDVDAVVPEAACARVALLERDGEHVVETVTLTGRWRPDTKEVVRRHLALKLVVEMADVELTLKFRSWPCKVLKSGVLLVVLHEHHWICRVLEVLGSELVLDHRAAVVDHVERDLGGGAVVELVFEAVTHEVVLRH